MIHANARVAILMTTFNGEDYLSAQVESLQKQTYTNWELYVRDDMSDDSTPAILQHYSQSDRRIHVVTDSVKRGARDGFMHLLESVDAELYMFCDHDDVWMPEKIARCVETYDEQSEHNIPLIIATDLKLVDEELNVFCESFWEGKKFPKSWFNDKYYHLFYDNIPGCVMLFNPCAKKVSFPYHPQTAMHDLWVIASVLWHGGHVVCVHEPLLLYRQHAKNVVGVRNIPTIGQQLGQVGQLFRKTLTQYDASRSLTSMGFPRFLLLKTYYSIRTHLLSPILRP